MSCKLEATAQLPVLRPFSLRQHYLSPPGQQCLLAPPSLATSSTPGPASSPAPGPTPSAISHSGSTAGDAAESRRGSTGAVALPADTACLMALDLTNTASCPVRPSSHSRSLRAFPGQSCMACMLAQCIMPGPFGCLCKSRPFKLELPLCWCFGSTPAHPDGVAQHKACTATGVAAVQ